MGLNEYRVVTTRRQLVFADCQQKDVELETDETDMLENNILVNII